MEIRSLNAGLEQRVQERTAELREAQEQLVQQEKLAVLGRVAGSVSHELRNPMGVIGNALYYLKLIQPDASEIVRKYHSMIQEEVTKSEKIINDLLNFTRGITADREPVAISELVQAVLSSYPAPSTVEVSVNLPADLPKVFIDPHQIEQAMGNLIINAYQAMPKGGKIIITAQRKKDMAAISIKDEGVGIPAENLTKVFEPLFTTKIVGIGLGLPISQKLIEANNGRIEVKSLPGKGSTFTVILPTKR